MVITYAQIRIYKVTNLQHYMILYRTNWCVIQNGWNSKSYSITNYCYTSGGCTVNVTLRKLGVILSVKERIFNYSEDAISRCNITCIKNYGLSSKDVNPINR